MSPHGPRRTTPAGVDAVLATGRRRLRRRRLSSAAASVSLAVVAAAALSANARQDTRGIEPVGEPAPSATASPSPAGSAPSATPTERPGDEPTRGPAELAPSSSPDPDATATPSPSEARRWVSHGPRDAAGRPAVEVRDYADPAACSDWGTAPINVQSGFCAVTTGPASLTVGTPARYTHTLCRLPGRPAATLEFATRQEVSFAAQREYDGRPPDWAWAEEGAFPRERHSVAFAGGDCRAWTVEWRGQGTDGYALPDGRYEVVAAVMPTGYPDPAPPYPASVFVAIEP